MASSPPTKSTKMARSIAATVYGCEVHQLSPAEVAAILAQLREQLPGFLAQLRMDVTQTRAKE
jgi:hypothetical protein